MRGAYCLVIELPEPHPLRIGALGRHTFEKGVYVYVGSAQGGVRQRVGRHLSKRKRTHWHIDYLLKRGEVLSTMVIPCDAKEGECAVAEAVARADGSTIPMPGFGSSDCSCESHLFYFGDVDAGWAAESLVRAVAFLPCAYEREAG